MKIAEVNCKLWISRASCSKQFSVTEEQSIRWGLNINASSSLFIQYSTIALCVEAITTQPCQPFHNSDETTITLSIALWKGSIFNELVALFHFSDLSFFLVFFVFFFSRLRLFLIRKQSLPNCQCCYSFMLRLRQIDLVFPGYTGYTGR